MGSDLEKLGFWGVRLIPKEALFTYILEQMTIKDNQNENKQKKCINKSMVVIELFFL